jgi:hypothetical protein
VRGRSSFISSHRAGSCAGLIGGFAVARYSHRRELGGSCSTVLAVTAAASGAAYVLADRTDTSF